MINRYNRPGIIIASYIVTIIMIIISYVIGIKNQISVAKVYSILSISMIVLGVIVCVILSFVKKILQKKCGAQYDADEEELQVHLLQELHISANELYESTTESNTYITGVYGMNKYGEYAVANINALSPLRKYKSCGVEYYVLFEYGEHKANIILARDEEMVPMIIHVDVFSNWSEKNVIAGLKAKLDCQVPSNEKREQLRRKYAKELWNYYFDKYDSKIASELHKFHKELDCLDIIEYNTKIQEYKYTYSDTDKYMYAKEIAFYVLPQAMPLLFDDRVRKSAEEMFQYVSEIQKKEYECSANDLSWLQQSFLIYNKKAAKAYYLQHHCDVSRYKNGYIEEEFLPIRESFEALKMETHYKEWKQEEYDRLLQETDGNIDRNLIQCMLYLGDDLYSKKNHNNLLTSMKNNESSINKKKKLKSIYKVYINNRKLGKKETKSSVASFAGYMVWGVCGIAVLSFLLVRTPVGTPLRYRRIYSRIKYVTALGVIFLVDMIYGLINDIVKMIKYIKK